MVLLFEVDQPGIAMVIERGLATETRLQFRIAVDLVEKCNRPLLSLPRGAAVETCGASGPPAFVASKAHSTFRARSFSTVSLIQPFHWLRELPFSLPWKGAGLVCIP